MLVTIQTLPRLTHIQKRMLQKMRTQWKLQEGMMKELLGGPSYKSPQVLEILWEGNKTGR